MILRLSISSLLFFSSLYLFSQTAGPSASTNTLNAPAFKEYLKNEAVLSRPEKKALRKIERAEKKAMKHEDRRIKKAAKKCPYRTVKCTYDWRD